MIMTTLLSAFNVALRIYSALHIIVDVTDCCQAVSQISVFLAMFWHGRCLTILFCPARSLYHARLRTCPFYGKVFMQSWDL